MTTKNSPPVSSDDLHAYADGQLPSELREHVEAYLANNPELSAEVKAWISQNELIRALVADTATSTARVNSALEKAYTCMGHGGRICTLYAGSSERWCRFTQLFKFGNHGKSSGYTFCFFANKFSGLCE